jgi:ribosomal protein L16/L10AE
LTLQTTPEHYLTAKSALRKASMKFPTPCSTKLVRGAEHLKGLV